MDQNQKVLEFISQNGEELVRNIFFNVHNIIVISSDYFWEFLKESKQDKLLQNEESTLFALLTTFISIRTELEMQAIYEKFGDEVYNKLGEYASSYYVTFLANFIKDEKEAGTFLMHSAHETLMDFQGEDYDVLLAMQFKKIAETEQDLSPSVFHPLMPALSEGGSLVDIIENNV